MTATAIHRPPLRYYGGKWRLGRRLVDLFPPHRVYTEAFGGGASVLLQKNRAQQEIYNDLDGEVVNVFRVLQSPARAKKLEQLLRVTPFARAEFELSYKPTAEMVERARRTIIRSFLGFGSDSITRIKASRAGFNTSASKATTMKSGFRVNSWRSNVSASMDWSHYPDQVASFCERLSGVVIENRDALKVLDKSDNSDALHYVDPPYPRSVRGSGNSDSRVEHNYRHEMLRDEQHEELAELLHRLKGMVVISSYPSDLYRRLYTDWHCIGWSGSQFCHGAAKRVEMVFVNPAAMDAAHQTQMFEVHG